MHAAPANDSLLLCRYPHTPQSQIITAAAQQQAALRATPKGTPVSDCCLPAPVAC